MESILTRAFALFVNPDTDKFHWGRILLALAVLFYLGWGVGLLVDDLPPPWARVVLGVFLTPAFPIGMAFGVVRSLWPLLPLIPALMFGFGYVIGRRLDALPPVGLLVVLAFLIGPVVVAGLILGARGEPAPPARFD